MRTTRGLLGFLLAFLPSVGLAAPPTVLESKAIRQHGPPLWLSAEAIANPKTGVDLTLLDSPFLEQVVEKQRRELGEGAIKMSLTVGAPAVVAIPPTQCKRLLDLSDHGDPRPNGTLDELSANSKSIVAGVIRELTLGFAFGMPMTLLTVDTTDAIKGAPTASFYLSYPIARFRVGPYHFCSATQGFEPRVGDRVLVFDYRGPIDQTGRLLSPGLKQLVFQSAAGRLFFPPQLQTDTALIDVDTLDEVADLVRTQLDHEPSDKRVFK